MNSRYIKSLRALRSLSQDQMAKLLDISIQSYNKKENGKIPFLASELKVLSEQFDVPMENFFNENIVKMTTLQ